MPDDGDLPARLADVVGALELLASTPASEDADTVNDRTDEARFAGGLFDQVMAERFDSYTPAFVAASSADWQEGVEGRWASRQEPFGRRAGAERTVGGWIRSSNVIPFLEMLSGRIGYAFDGWDADAIAAGLTDTDADEPSAWWSYPLVGDIQLDVRLACNPGADPVSVVVIGRLDAGLAASVDELIAVMARYDCTT